MNSLTEIFGDPISTYTRAQAIEDGVLVDVSETATEAGITFPVAITQGLWTEWIEPSEFLRRQGQDVAGRLWDTVYMLRLAAQRGGARIDYKVIYLAEAKRRLRDGTKVLSKTVTLKALCGPGDDADPVITIMLPDED